MSTDPVLIERQGDLGWLAVSPPESALRIGVIATDADEATALYRARLERWESIPVD